MRSFSSHQDLCTQAKFGACPAIKGRDWKGGGGHNAPSVFFRVNGQNTCTSEEIQHLLNFCWSQRMNQIQSIIYIAAFTFCPGGRGGGVQLPLKGGHHARLKKHVKRVVFHGRAMYARTVERVSKLPKFGKKGILFNSFDTRLGYIFY